MMLPLILLACISTAFALNSTYQLRVYAGNKDVHGAVLAWDNTDGAFVPAALDIRDFQPIFVRHGPETSATGISLVAVQSPDDDDQEAPWYVALQGASRRAQYRMVASQYDRTFDIGTTFLFDDWRFVEYGERLVLRYGDNQADASHWVVAKKSGGWILWWMEPTENNLGDELKGYVMVDVEVERLGDEEEED
ncbi:uncharacterized protein DNG_08156 [Cephalotrichum gorgonifer]|uniref:Uncharacterized protein n=1 Tax=Cephalotrichum gorgonifer TaxID=2041049 RepID=A0AAE8N4N5_9PEZI|nr:uncharacterized protein DNG_08156 [Cephalotrichum gorgonifer]